MKTFIEYRDELRDQPDTEWYATPGVGAITRQVHYPDPDAPDPQDRRGSDEIYLDSERLMPTRAAAVGLLADDDLDILYLWCRPKTTGRTDYYEVDKPVMHSFGTEHRWIACPRPPIDRLRDIHASFQVA